MRLTLEQTLTWLKPLIEARTIEGQPNAVLSLIAWIESEAHKRGAVTLYKGDGLILRYGDAVTGRKGLGIAGHLDVVGVAGQTWQSDPFTLTIKDNKAYGRGTCDMKGSIAGALALMDAYSPQDIPCPLYIILSTDEETRCASAPTLVPTLTTLKDTLAGVIVAEPTELNILNRHAGVQDYRTLIKGCACHAGNPRQGKNAIAAGARLVQQVMNIGENFAHSPANLAFDPPFSVTNVGLIQGGSAVNTVAGDCTIDYECRPLSLADRSLFEQSLAAWADSEVKSQKLEQTPQTELTCDIPAFEKREAAAPFTATVMEALRQTEEASKTLAPPRQAPFATEAGIYQSADLNVVICGAGSINQAHRADEFVDLTQLEDFGQMIDRLLYHFSIQKPFA